MLLSLFSRYMSIFAAICVLALFFFPLVQGPFQATHGPTTAFRSKRDLLGLLLSIAAAALQVFAVFFFRSFLHSNYPFRGATLESGSESSVDCHSILRC
jgi:TRAP-type C4-dicarboxylate transport system permease small subunit